MLFEPLLGASLSGKLGGIVASHNAGGPYFRAFVIPTNPNTPFQIAVRALMASLTATWSSGLTQAQRDAWDLYAFNVPITNRIGNQINISGEAMYVRTNIPRIQSGGARQDIAPVIFNLGSKTASLASNATVAAQTIDVSFGTGGIIDSWANETGSFLLIYVSRPVNAGIQFFRGPYRFAGAIQGDPVPPAPPATIGAPFAFALGQRLFIRTQVTRNDSRLSADDRASTIAIA